jgi:2-polyprenyl-6-methoxyphenol hydroxylase-like FAD-dependent oxidoreductase
MEQSPSGRHAIIIGAGIGGLAAAIALGRAGWSVEVRERSPHLEEGGTALAMWPEAMRALDDLGLREAIERHGTTTRGASILSSDGAPLGRIPGDRSVLLVSRFRLLSALHDAMPPGAIRWSQGFEGSDDLPRADLVVAADGIHSSVRAAVWSSSPERPLGTVAFRGVVGGTVQTVTETWGPGALFGITPTSDGRTNWFACVRGSTRDGRVAPSQYLRERFSGWHPAVSNVVQMLDDDDIDTRTLTDVRIRHRYVRGNVALLGDAAHAMAPNLGRGACESVLDATALAHAMDTAPDIATGLRRYDRMRRHRTQQIVGVARLLNRVATAEYRLGIRNRVVRMMLARPTTTMAA